MGTLKQDGDKVAGYCARCAGKGRNKGVASWPASRSSEASAWERAHRHL